MSGVAVHEVTNGFYMNTNIELKLFFSLGSAKHIVLCAGTGVAVKQRYSYYTLKQRRL